MFHIYDEKYKIITKNALKKMNNESKRWEKNTLHISFVPCMADFSYTPNIWHSIKFPHTFSITAEHDTEQNYCTKSRQEIEANSLTNMYRKKRRKMSRKWILQVEHLNCNVIQIIFYRNFICWICFFHMYYFVPIVPCIPFCHCDQACTIFRSYIEMNTHESAHKKSPTGKTAKETLFMSHKNNSW